MWAEKSTENPMHMMRLIIDIVSKLTPHRHMYPMTPTRIDTIEKPTHKAHNGFGMKTSVTAIMIIPATTID
jgi:hypothetical protein